ncbi:hypothetical protein Btru_043957 [Bulinus truncatus]|nr:hypothetical protein Btru_043957 [Bulinus truncatus]
MLVVLKVFDPRGLSKYVFDFQLILLTTYTLHRSCPGLEVILLTGEFRRYAMLTLATNVFPCRVHQGSVACMTGLHGPHTPLDIPDFGSSRVSVIGHCPPGYLGHFNQGVSNCQRGHDFQMAPFPGNVGPPPSFVSPARPPRPAIHIYPTFVNVTNVHNTPCHHLQPVGARNDHMKHCSPFPLISESSRLPPFSVMTTAPLHHSICAANDNKCSNGMDSGHKLGFEPRSQQELSSFNQYQAYSVKIVTNKSEVKSFESTKWIERDNRKKRSSVHYRKKLQDATSTDITHSIASILSSSNGITSERCSPEGASISPCARPLSCDAVAGELSRDSPVCYESGSDISVDGSHDGGDMSDVDVTSCSGDENDESESSASSSASDRGVDDVDRICSEMDENYKTRGAHYNTSTPVLASHIRKESGKNNLTEYINTQKDTGNRYDSMGNNSAVTADKVSSVLKNSCNMVTDRDKKAQHTDESSFAHHSKLGASNNCITKTLPPIESLRHPMVRSNDESASRSAFKPIARAEKGWAAMVDHRLRNREFPNYVTHDANKDENLNGQWKTVPISKDAVKHKTKGNIRSQRRQGGDSDKSDAIDMLRQRSFLYQKQGIPDRLFHTAGNLPHSLGAWFRWLRHGEMQSGQQVSSTSETPLAARFPPPPRYYCEACNKTYSTFGGLSKHRQFHCTEHVRKEFACNVCSKSYSSLGALKMHIRTHTLPCKCHVCGKAFSRPWLLQGHVRTHTGEKPFRCSHCGRAFADRSNLRAHLQTHAEIKKYACRKCGKTFSRMSLLAKHSDGSCPENSRSIPRDDL